MDVAELLTQVAVGLAVFASTNIDDLLLLAVFFADPHLRTQSVVIGQFAGIGALVLVSTVAALASLAIPPGWPALLGVVPLALGVRALRLLRRTAVEEEQKVHAKELEAERRSGSQVLAIAAVTMANGGDNLGVYIPLFAGQPSAIPVHASLFAVLTGVWCALGHWLVNNRIVGETVRRQGRVALPFVLLGLGTYILAGARVLFDK